MLVRRRTDDSTTTYFLSMVTSKQTVEENSARRFTVVVSMFNRSRKKVSSISAITSLSSIRLKMGAPTDRFAVV